MTGYLVLRKRADARVGSENYEAWEPLGEFKAASSDAAIKACAEKNGKGEYVAVPARSWQPKKVTEVKQVTEVKFA